MICLFVESVGLFLHTGGALLGESELSSHDFPLQIVLSSWLNESIYAGVVSDLNLDLITQKEPVGSDCWYF